jgi:hypothetical protein
MQERIQSFRKQVLLRNCRIGTLKYQPQKLGRPQYFGPKNCGPPLKFFSLTMLH